MRKSVGSGFEPEAYFEPVSTKDLIRARQKAKRRKAENACRLCRDTKVKCSIYRPCARCLQAERAEACTVFNSFFKFLKCITGIDSRFKQGSQRRDTNDSNFVPRGQEIMQPRPISISTDGGTSYQNVGLPIVPQQSPYATEMYFPSNGQVLRFMNFPPLDLMASLEWEPPSSFLASAASQQADPNHESNIFLEAGSADLLPPLRHVLSRLWP